MWGGVVGVEVQLDIKDLDLLNHQLFAESEHRRRCFALSRLLSTKAISLFET